MKITQCQKRFMRVDSEAVGDIFGEVRSRSHGCGPLTSPQQECFMADIDLTAARLRQLLRYDPTTGAFVRLQDSFAGEFGNVKMASAGDIAGCLMANGYIAISVDGTAYLGHRLAWLHETGAWPEDLIDHRDGVRSNNRWLNLRPATQARREQLRTFINMGRTLYAAPEGQSSLIVETVAPATPLAASNQKSDSQKARIADGAAALIAANGPMQTRAILEQLLARGIEIGGGNKIDTVSVALTRSRDRFKSDRSAGGWMLINTHKEETPSGAPTPAGS